MGKPILKLRNNSISYIPVIFSSAFLLIFSFPPFNIWLLAWIALIPLFLLIPATDSTAGRYELSPKEIFVFYYLAGLIFWAYHIWWLTYLTFAGYSLLVIYLASFLGLFGLLLKVLRERTRYPLLFLAPPLWILFEFIRTYLFTGFPWSLLGYSQWNNIPLIQISSITGVYGVSFLVVMINAAISDFIFSRTKKHPRLPARFTAGGHSFGRGGQVRNVIFSILIVLGIVVVGEKIILTPPKTGQAVEDESHIIKISVIQGNIPQAEKWDEEYFEEIVNTYAELSIYAGRNPNISLIVWPETSYPDYVDIDSALFKKIKSLTRFLDIPLLMGGVRQQNGRDYNSALLILSDGEIKQTYDKLHLVPFGEYIPLKKIFFFLHKTTPQIGDFSKGEEYTIFEISDGVPARQDLAGGRHSASSESSDRNPKSEIRNRFAVLTCFEDLFPDLSRRFTKEGAEFLINITNDAHFHESPALWQHFTHSVFRAIENRRPVIRAANNGISGFIDSYGRPVKILNENGKARGVRGYATNRISPSSYKTFYTRFGDLFVYLNVLYLVILLMISVRVNIKKL